MEELYRNTRAHKIFLEELAGDIELLNVDGAVNRSLLLERVHKLKGTADFFAYTTLSELLENLESSFKKEEWFVTDQLSALHAEMENILSNKDEV